MALIDDIIELNPADTQGDWTTLRVGFDAPTLNNASSTVPIFLEDTECMEWRLKKDQTLGYTATTVMPATPSMVGRIVVGLLGYPLAELDGIPISAFFFRVSSSTGFTSDYTQWDAEAQLQSPLNVPVSNMTPIMGFEDSFESENGTPDLANLESVGWVATSGGTADGKQGGFDFMFIVGYLGAESQTFTNDFFSDLYEEYFDGAGGGLPNTVNRPLGVLSQSGAFFQTNVSFRLGDGSSDSANIVVEETGKTIFFANLHDNHELGYIFVNPSSSNECRFILTDCVHFWNGQASSNEIFTDASNADYFQLVGCAFSDGGQITLPGDNANRFVRNTKFTSCQSGTASDGEFTNSILSGCLQMAISGDADFTGTQVLLSAVAADTGAIAWNGSTDPDGQLDNMSFSQGATAHHAIDFGTSVTSDITLRGIEFTDFDTGEDGNGAALRFLATTGSLNCNLIDCTVNGAAASSTNLYKDDAAGIAVTLIFAPVDLTITVNAKSDLTAIQNAQTSIHLADSPFTELMNEDTTAGGVATESYAGSVPVSVVWKVRKSDELDDPRYFAQSGVDTITTEGFNLTVLLEENPFI